MDIIKIKNLEVFAYHGVFEEEKRTGQSFFVDAELELDCRKAGLTDDLNESVSYAEVAELIHAKMTEKSYDLIECCAETLAREILMAYPLIKAVTIELHKPDAPIGLPFEDVGVRIRRTVHRAYIALGSNIGESEQILADAVNALDGCEGCRVVKQSTIIRTKPYGYTDQPDFLNGMLELETLYTAHELLDKLHEIEAAAGRTRDLRWGPRTLDLDIILFDDEVIEDDDLCVPHIDMANRSFVLEPLAEIAPHKLHPLKGKRIAEMLAELKARNE